MCDKSKDKNECGCGDEKTKNEKSFSSGAGHYSAPLKVKKENKISLSEVIQIIEKFKK